MKADLDVYKTMSLGIEPLFPSVWTAASDRSCQQHKTFFVTMSNIAKAIILISDNDEEAKLLSHKEIIPLQETGGSHSFVPLLSSFPSPHLGPIVWVNRSRGGEREKPPCTVSPSLSLN